MLNNDINNKIDSVFDEPFLGDSLAFSDEEKSLIYDEVGSLLRRVGEERGETIGRSDYKMVVVALVELTKEWESDEDAWLEFISKRLLGSQFDIRGKIYSQICKCIDSLNGIGKLFVFDCFTKKYYTSICSHAFAPKTSVFAFFDMCWEIYCKDLFQQYAPNDPILRIVATSLRNKFSLYKSDDEDIKIGSKAYAFRAGIKGLAIDKEYLLIKLLDSSILGMHAIINNEPIATDTYSRKLLKEWWAEKEASFGIKRERSISRREFVATDYSQIKAKYMLDSGKAKLVISPFRLVENFDYEPYIQVKINGETVKNEPIPTRGSGIIMTTKAVEYDLDSFLLKGNDEIEVEISHTSKNIYSSKNALKRSFMVFNGNKEASSQTLLPGTYFIFTPQISEIVHPSDIQRITKNLYSFVATEGDVIRSSDRIVFFETERTKKDIYITSSEKQGAFYREEGMVYKIIDGDLYVNVSSEYDVSDLGVRYEDGSFKLSEFDHTEENGIKRIKISILAAPGEPFSISVFRFSDNYILDALNVIKFDNISISFDKEIYYGDDCVGVISFKTERYNLKGNFDIADDENTIVFGNGEIVFTPPVLKWRFDEGEWHSKPSLPFYFKKITNSSVLEIQMPLQMEFNVGILPSGRFIEQSGEKPIFKVGQTVHSLDGSLVDDATIFVQSGSDLFEIAQVFLKQKFVSDPFYVRSEEYRIEWDPKSFVGEDSPTLKLQIANYRNEVIDDRVLNMKESETINVGFLDEDYYTLRVVMAGRGFLVKETELFSKKYLFGDIKSIRFKGKILKINKAIIFDQSLPQRIRPLYLSNLSYLGMKDGADVYSGRLFIIDKGDRIYIDYMRKSQDEHVKVKINPVRIELKTLSSCYLGYGLDVEDPDFEYEDEFVLTYDGKTTIGTSATRNRGVDFYMFQEEHEERR